jgi:hypothetical protein
MSMNLRSLPAPATCLLTWQSSWATIVLVNHMLDHMLLLLLLHLCSLPLPATCLLTWQ